MRALMVATAVLAATVAHLYGTAQDARHERDAYRSAYEQWMRYGEQQHQAALVWREAAGALRIELAATINRLSSRLAEAEARVPFDRAFLDWAREVARCESTNNPRATNGTQAGLMQIDIPSHRARIERLGFTPADMLEPIPNLIVAESIWREQGPSPWPHCGRAR
jgi:hypothetical protein